MFRFGFAFILGKIALLMLAGILFMTTCMVIMMSCHYVFTLKYESGNGEQYDYAASTKIALFLFGTLLFACYGSVLWFYGSLI